MPVVFGRNVRTYREERGWSQSELARQMNTAGWTKYSQVAVSRTEDGTRAARLDEAVALADVLGVELDSLTRDSKSQWVRKHFREAERLRLALVRSGWEYFQQQLRLRRELEKVPEALTPVEDAEARAMIQEAPEIPALETVRDWMQRWGIESFQDFRNRYYFEETRKWDAVLDDIHEKIAPEGDHDA